MTEIILPLSEEIQEEINYALEGARQYRNAELEYGETIVFGTDLLPEITDDVWNADIYGNITSLVDSAAISLALKDMQEIKEEYGLQIGGRNGRYRIGEKHIFDPSRHFYPENIHKNSRISMPRHGEPVIVYKSQIDTMIEGKEYLLLPPDFATFNTSLVDAWELPITPPTPPSPKLF